MSNKVMIAQHNDLTLARQDFSLIEGRCLYLVIKEIRRLFIDRKWQDKEVAQEDLFRNRYLRVHASALQQLGDETKHVYDALKRLRKRDVTLRHNTGEWVDTGYILQAKHIPKSEMYEILVSGEIMPYLVDLTKNFTTLSYYTAIAAQSTYTQRFLGFCNMYRNKGKFYLEIDRLLYMLKLEDKKSYQNSAELKRRVLDPAQQELKEMFDAGQSDIYFTYKPKDKHKKRILSYWFDIHTKESEEKRLLDFATTQGQVKRILEICRTFILNDKKVIERIETFLNLNPDQALPILEKLQNKVLDYPKEEIPAIIRWVLYADFGVETMKKR